MENGACLDIRVCAFSRQVLLRIYFSLQMHKGPLSPLYNEIGRRALFLPDTLKCVYIIIIAA